MDALKKIIPSRKPHLWQQTKKISIDAALSKNETSDIETIADHCSIIMKEFNRLDSQCITQEFFIQDVLTSLREIHFLQDSFVWDASNKDALRRSFSTFQHAISSLAEKLLIDNIPREHFSLKPDETKSGYIN